MKKYKVALSLTLCLMLVGCVNFFIKPAEAASGSIYTTTNYPINLRSPLGATNVQLPYSNGSTPVTVGATTYYGGNPNGNVAGQLRDVVFDTATANIYYCTVAGNAAGAVWTVNAAGAGDVSGPSSAASNNITTFSGTTGKLVKDSGIQAVTYGTASNMFIGAGGASGNPSIGIGARNIGLGGDTLTAVTTGVDNIAIGWLSLVADTVGSGNTAFGTGALAFNLGGNFNSAFGISALGSSTSGHANTASGYNALQNLISGGYNTALGQNSGGNYTGAESSNIDIANAGTLGESNVMHVGTVGSGNGQVLTGYWGNVNIPLSTSINTILYNSAANQIAQIAPVNNAVVVTNAGGVPSESTTLPSGLTIPGYATTGNLNSYCLLVGCTMTGTLAINTASPAINFLGTTTNNVIQIPNNLADAYDVSDVAGNNYFRVNSSTTRPRSSFNKESIANAPLTMNYPIDFSGGNYVTGTASQSGTTAVTGSGTTFPVTSGAHGLIYWVTTGDYELITSRNSATSLTVDQSLTESGNYVIYYGGVNASNYGVSILNGGFLESNSIDTPQSASGQGTTLTVGGTNATGINIHPPFTAALNMGSHLINNLTDPVSAQDAATKNYVDTKLTGTSALTTRVIVHARYVHGAITNTLSAMTIGYVDFGAAYLTGSGPASYTAFTASQDGTFSFQFSGWDCGVGDNTQEVIDTRGGSTIVYDQKKGSPAGTCLEGSQVPFVVPNVLLGDVFTFKLNENNAGTIVTSITDNTAQAQGDFTASIVQTYP